MQLLKKIDELPPKQNFFIGFILGVLIFCVIGSIIILNIKYENPFNGLTAPILGIMTAYIAYRQYKISKNQLKLDLYNKRFELFECIRDLFIEIEREAQNKDGDKYYNFVIKVDNSKFLFEQDIIDYTQEIKNKINRLKLINFKLDKERIPVGEERTTLAYENSEILGWFFAELHGNLHKKFNNYLNINNIK